MSIAEAIIADPSVVTMFSVILDGNPLGVFASCEGLGVEVVLEQREEGGNNEFIHQLPVRLRYSNVKLTRPIDHQSKLVADWLTKMHGTLTRSTARITALDSYRSPVTSWSLKGVMPV